MIHFLALKKFVSDYFGKNHAPRHTTWEHHARVFMLIVFIMLVIRDATVCEDAMITVRTVDNWLHGFGLRWNVNERLQVFTHPFWMFILSVVIGVSGEVFYSVIFFSVFVSVIAVYFFSSRLFKDGWGMMVGLTLLLFSRAFIDFSTSGLANPLVHLLIILFMMFFKDTKPRTTSLPKLFLLSLLSCLAVLTRMDTALIFLPAMLYLFIDALRHSRRGRAVAALLLGYSAFFLWELFSLIYYGFLLPNTFYAKMSHGIPKSEILAQGLFYLRNANTWDPLTLFTMLTGIILGLSAAFRNRMNISLSIGALLYLIYVVWVGGDHMGGRFFTAPFLCTVIIIATLPLQRRVQGIVLVVAVLLGLNGKYPTLSNDFEANQCKLDPAKIVYEQGCCKPAFSLASRSLEFQFRHNYRAMDGLAAREKGPHVIVEGMAGIFGFYAGPEVHIIDPLGLTDPLLARIPMLPIEWRTAHFVRPIPAGYEAAVVGEGTLMDPSLAAYYERLSIVTRGEIWSLNRFKEIWKFNTGAYDHLIEGFCRRRFNVDSCDAVKRKRESGRRRKEIMDRQQRIKQTSGK